MTTGIIVLCRLSSRRLPGKILMEIDGTSILQHILNRLELVQAKETIVVATSDHESDDRIASYCEKNQINCYRGDLNNVALRFLGAAQEYGFDYATRINGDNLFIDIDALQSMIKISQSNEYDFITNVKNRTFPFGMSIEIVKTDFYHNLMDNLSSKDYQEHVTLYLYHNENYGRQYHFENDKCPEAKGLRLAIDEAKDYQKAKAIMAVLKPQKYQYNLNELVQIVKNI